jgi:hypothetical protein
MNIKAITRIAMIQIIIIAGIAFLVTSCNPQRSDQENQSAPQNPILTKEYGSFITASSFADLGKKSSLIVIGHVTNTDYIINMARNPKDPQVADSQVFGVGQVYQVQIKQFLKGQGDDILFIVQHEGFLGQSSPKTEADIQKAKTSENYIPLTLEKDYLMFLGPMVGFHEGKYYAGVAQPWRFDLSDPNNVLPESPWQEAIKLFPPQSLASINQQIEHPELFLSTPYPGTTYP